MQPGGSLGESIVGEVLGTGTGRGIGFMFVIAGGLLLIVSGIVALIPHIRNLESELPDVIPDVPKEIVT